MRDINELKKRLLNYLTRRAPGAVDLYNMYCMLTYKTDCISLLFTTPSKLYYLILNHYKGDSASADYAFTLLFLGPLALLTGRAEIARELLELVKSGRDREFVELIIKYIGNSAC